MRWWRSAPGLTYQQFWANCLQAMGVPHAEWAEPDHDAYRGRFAVAPSNGSFQDFVSAMRVAEGVTTLDEVLRTTPDWHA